MSDNEQADIARIAREFSGAIHSHLEDTAANLLAGFTAYSQEIFKSLGEETVQQRVLAHDVQTLATEAIDQIRELAKIGNEMAGQQRRALELIESNAGNRFYAAAERAGDSFGRTQAEGLIDKYLDTLLRDTWPALIEKAAKAGADEAAKGIRLSWLTWAFLLGTGTGAGLVLLALP